MTASTEAPETASTTKTSKNYRNYIVLRKREKAVGTDVTVTADVTLSETETYDKVGVYWASDDQQAVRHAVKQHGLAEYVAVAEGAWHVRKPVSEPQPDRIRF